MCSFLTKKSMKISKLMGVGSESVITQWRMKVKDKADGEGTPLLEGLFSASEPPILNYTFQY
ncbi:MAG: hypothetical protein MJE68_15130 [Proteobacteria bacterium]|nr:hypothetical protein [Pseudomonadota bacterium]